MLSFRNAAFAAAFAVTAITGCAGADSAGYDKPGFVTEVKENRLWVFKADSKDLAEFRKHGDLMKVVTRIGEGPNGMTLKAGDAKTLDEYAAAK